MSEIKKDLFEGNGLNRGSAPAVTAGGFLKLSPSSLNLFLDCPRCFWLDINRGMKRPGVPVATITTGLDRVVKEFFNEYRARGVLPPLLEGRVSGKLMPNFPKRGWLDYNDRALNAKLGGYLDECIQLDEKHYAVLDHKTRGSAPDSVHKAYQLQMDVYTLLLEENNFSTRRSAYIAYYIPKKIISGADFQFEVLIKELRTDPDRAREVFASAVKSLRGPIAAPNKECGFCNWTATSSIK